MSVASSTALREEVGVDDGRLDGFTRGDGVRDVVIFVARVGIILPLLRYNPVLNR